MARRIDRDLLREVRERYDSGVDADRNNRKREADDRKFFTGGDNQWLSADGKTNVAQERRNEGRPAETFNRLGPIVRQVTGEIRQNKPQIKVLPVDGQTDPELAKIYAAIIRHVEAGCDAHRIYSRETEKAAIGGQGWWRVNADYCDDSGFDQDLMIEGVPNPLAVVCDPDARHPTRKDMSWCFVTELVSRKKFEATYKDISPTDFDGDEMKGWVEGDFVRIAEYWVKRPDGETTLYALERTDTGVVENVTTEELKAMAEAGGVTFTKVEELLAGLPVEVKAERQIKKFKVQSILVCGAGELSDWQDWPGRHIPLVRVVGEEVEANDEVFRHGLVHHAKPACVSYNFARNASMERYGASAKTPWIATVEQIEPYKSFWETANKKNWPVLPYKHQPGVNPPSRIAPPSVDAAAYQEMQAAAQDIQAITGIYDSHLGQRSNEQSGVAIAKRDQQGDTGTYVYIDNMEAAIDTTGRILIDLIPHYYSDERIIRLLGEDGEVEKFEAINKLMPDGKKWNDVTRGKYDVVVTTGPAYATKRQEAADNMLKLAEMPQVAAAGADLIIRALDLPMGDKLADRVKMMLPPGIDEEVDRERQEKGQGQEQQPNPEQMALMAEQERKQAEFQMKAQEGQQKMQLAQAEAQAKLQLMREESQAKLQLEREKAAFQAESERLRRADELQLAREQMHVNAAIARDKSHADAASKVEMSKNRPGGDLDK